MDQSRIYAHARVAVAPGDSTSSRERATATRRWTREETRARVAAGPEFPHPSPTPSGLDYQVRAYEQMTCDKVRTQAKRNLLAACYRLHGDDFLSLVRETFDRTGTATNLLGELRVLPPRQVAEVSPDVPDSTDVVEPGGTIEQLGPELRPGEEPVRGDATRLAIAGPNSVDVDSAWCGCPEKDLLPDLLYCAPHRPKFGSFPKRRYDRREPNPAAARFFSEADESSATCPQRP